MLSKVDYLIDFLSLIKKSSTPEPVHRRILFHAVPRYEAAVKLYSTPDPYAPSTSTPSPFAQGLALLAQGAVSQVLQIGENLFDFAFIYLVLSSSFVFHLSVSIVSDSLPWKFAPHYGGFIACF